MIFILDTCVVSEIQKPQPCQKVLDWLLLQPENDLFVSALTLGEIEKGISRLPESSKKHFLNIWFQDDFLKRFDGRVVAVDSAVALKWGSLSSSLERIGKKMPVIDGLLAATALNLNAVLVTRNENDFVSTGVAIVNPWN